MSHEDPHLRPMFNRVISNKAQLSNKDPHPFPYTSTGHGAQCHTRTLTHDPFIEVHEAAYEQPPHSRSLPNRIYEATSHKDPHLRPLSNRVKSSKAHSSHKDPHSFPFINKDNEAHCHTRTLSHDPFIGAKHGAACARMAAGKTGRGPRHNGRTRHNNNGRTYPDSNDHSPQEEQRTRPHTHYIPPTSTKHNQSHSHYHWTKQKLSRHETPTKRTHTTKPLSNGIKQEEQILFPQNNHQSKQKHLFHLWNKDATFRKQNLPDQSPPVRPPNELPQDFKDTQSETRQQGRGFS